MKSILALQKTLQVVIHSGAGQPVALKVNVPQLVAWLSSILITMLLLGAGSLLFFRELEVNRKLQTRLLVFETEEKLWQTSWNNGDGVAPTPTISDKAGDKHAAAPVAAKLAERTTIERAMTTESVAPSSAVARISELATACNGEECQVRLSMSTSGAGAADGYLLIVMETEVPRIGGNASPEAQMRKRYFFYPEQEPRDELEPDGVLKLQHKAFRFGRALKTSASFKVGRLLRPLFVNAYLFDSKHAPIQHERHPVNEEP